MQSYTESSLHIATKLRFYVAYMVLVYLLELHGFSNSSKYLIKGDTTIQSTIRRILIIASNASKKLVKYYKEILHYTFLFFNITHETAKIKWFVLITPLI